MQQTQQCVWNNISTIDPYNVQFVNVAGFTDNQVNASTAWIVLIILIIFVVTFTCQPIFKPLKRIYGC